MLKGGVSTPPFLFVSDTDKMIGIKRFHFKLNIQPRAILRVS